MSNKTEQEALARLGAHVTTFALRHGWKSDGPEGAFEYIQRISYTQGMDDARPYWVRTYRDLEDHDTSIQQAIEKTEERVRFVLQGGLLDGRPNQAQEKEAARQWDEWAGEMNRCRDATLEQVARICDEEGREWDSDALVTTKNYVAHCATRIRALKNTPRQYHYRMADCTPGRPECREGTGYSECPCWHDIGTGPLAGREATATDWRDKPGTPETRSERILFPTYLRKMWSGGEVQAWLDEHQGITPPKATTKGSVERYRKWQAEQEGKQHALAVWYGCMPESNGKSNWTAILHRKGDGLMDGPHITIDRSEYPDRVRYEADRVRFIIGEIDKEPFVLDYDDKLVSPPFANHGDSNAQP